MHRFYPVILLWGGFSSARTVDALITLPALTEVKAAEALTALSKVDRLLTLLEDPYQLLKANAVFVYNTDRGENQVIVPLDGTFVSMEMDRDYRLEFDADRTIDVFLTKSSSLLEVKMSCRPVTDKMGDPWHGLFWPQDTCSYIQLVGKRLPNVYTLQPRTVGPAYTIQFDLSIRPQHVESFWADVRQEIAGLENEIQEFADSMLQGIHDEVQEIMDRYHLATRHSKRATILRDLIWLVRWRLQDDQLDKRVSNKLDSLSLG